MRRSTNNRNAIFILFLFLLMISYRPGFCQPTEKSTSTSLTAIGIEEEFLGEKQKMDGAGGYREVKEWRIYVNFPIFKQRVPIAKRSEEILERRNKPYLDGVDRDTIKCKWIKENSILWIHWETESHGSGGYVCSGNILVRIRNGKTEDLFRDLYLAYARGGWTCEENSGLSFDCDESTVTLSKATYCFSADEKKPIALSTRRPDERNAWVQEFNYTTTYAYALEDSGLIFKHQSEKVEIVKASHPPQAIADYFCVPLDRLLVANPKRNSNEAWGGTINLPVLDPKPYKADFSEEPGAFTR
jgi:hypothetical protein